MRLLLIEDDPDLGAGLASALGQSGYTVDVARDGRTALAACGTASYQLVILDLGLPDFDGVEVLRRLRRQRTSAPVLVLTARDELEQRVLALDSGGDDYLTKPFAVAELEARIRALLRRGDPTGPTLSVFDVLYGWDDNAGLSNVEVFVSRLRRKLTQAGANVGIRTFRGLGYRLEKEASDAKA